MDQAILSGNEAIARGAWEAGVHYGSAYPGTPSTEILENLATYDDLYCQWSPNEKVALETAAGAAYAGGRALCAMKHVGLNVAADPFFTMSYTGVSGGLVIISADDPAMHSSQNEQDNRHYARAAKVPMLEPADSQEAKDLIGVALDISEKFDTPVLFRVTTRVCHAKGIVELKDRVKREVPGFKRDIPKYVMVPGNARKRHVIVEERTKALEEFGNTFEWNRMEMRDTKLGIVTSGVTYQYVREVLPDASVLKLVMTNPLPKQLIREFANKVDELWVVEELDPFLEEQIRAMGIAVKAGKDRFPNIGEFSPEVVRRGAFGEQEHMTPADNVPARPPVLCPGCPHRGMFHIFSRMKLTVTGDIGCYTLGALPPLNGMDTCLCMGASVGQSIGIDKVDPEAHTHTVATIGDSTFIHSGITGLVDMVYNNTKATLVILDNGTTAMTGQQEHPMTGRTLMGQPAKEVDLPALCEAVGVEFVRQIDPFDLDAVRTTMKEAVAFDGPSVVIAKAPCLFVHKYQREGRVVMDVAQCRECDACFRIGCPAIEASDDNPKIPHINYELCTHCGVCVQVCKFDALTIKQLETGAKA